MVADAEKLCEEGPYELASLVTNKELAELGYVFLPQEEAHVGSSNGASRKAPQVNDAAHALGQQGQGSVGGPALDARPPTPSLNLTFEEAPLTKRRREAASSSATPVGSKSPHMTDFMHPTRVKVAFPPLPSFLRGDYDLQTFLQSFTPHSDREALCASGSNILASTTLRELGSDECPSIWPVLGNPLLVKGGTKLVALDLHPGKTSGCGPCSAILLAEGGTECVALDHHLGKTSRYGPCSTLLSVGDGPERVALDLHPEKTPGYGLCSAILIAEGGTERVALDLHLEKHLDGTKCVDLDLLLGKTSGCGPCSAIFLAEDGTERVDLDLHPGKTSMCGLCSAIFITEDETERVALDLHLGKTLGCGLCSAILFAEDGIERVALDLHPGKTSGTHRLFDYVGAFIVLSELPLFQGAAHCLLRSTQSPTMKAMRAYSPIVVAIHLSLIIFYPYEGHFPPLMAQMEFRCQSFGAQFDVDLYRRPRLEPVAQREGGFPDRSPGRGSIGLQDVGWLFHPLSFTGFQLPLQTINNHLVSVLDLPVRLRVPYRCVAMFDPPTFKDVVKRLGLKLCYVVRNHMLGDTKVADDLFGEELLALGPYYAYQRRHLHPLHEVIDCHFNVPYVPSTSGESAD
ncbi:unnamed protein product [Cuscuta campestris]|uniref:Uncharacterized protein n=1 Tax=Cuscuta campestris TaxID=132261 RepID=A0A484LQR2_9ASTE|nr:unnamed protein product [Cuscuta campestris]